MQTIHSHMLALGNGPEMPSMEKNKTYIFYLDLNEIYSFFLFTCAISGLSFDKGEQNEKQDEDDDDEEVEKKTKKNSNRRAWKQRINKIKR